MIEDLEKIKYYKKKTLHQKIIYDILTEKNKIKIKKNKALKKENDESNYEIDYDEEQKEK